MSRLIITLVLLLCASSTSWAQAPPPEPVPEEATEEKAPAEEAATDEESGAEDDTAVEAPAAEEPTPPPPAAPETEDPIPDEVSAQASIPPNSRDLVRDATFSRHGPGVLAPGQMSVGLFAPVRAGITDGLELSIHPLLSLLVPQVEARKVWTGGSDWLVSTSHAIGCPTPLLSTLSREGIGGILPADTKVPFILSTTHHVRYGTTVGNHHRLTVRLGFGAGLQALGDGLPTIDLALVYPRTAPWVHGFAANVGLDLEGSFDGPLGYALDLDIFLVPDGGPSWHIEQGASIRWRMTRSSQLLLGVKATYGEYPFGVQRDVVPVLDLQWDFQAWGGQG